MCWATPHRVVCRIRAASVWMTSDAGLVIRREVGGKRAGVSGVVAGDPALRPYVREENDSINPHRLDHAHAGGRLLQEARDLR